MADSLGNITVPGITPEGTFPIVPDFPWGRAHKPEVVIHQFGSGNAKIEQRFVLGTGAKRFTVRKAVLRDADRIALRDFFEVRHGGLGAFTYNAPNDNGVGTSAYTCRFAIEPLSWDMLGAAVASLNGVTLIEAPTANPSYTIAATQTRFPGAALQTALLSQVQELIPLISIVPKQPGYPAIHVSDRRCTIGGQLYLPRLLDFDGISQGIGNESDEARFTFGNADRALRDLANDVDLFRAAIEFALFHVGTLVKLDLWKGEIVDWSMNAGPEFQIMAADGLYELNLPYPTRRISRTCWKQFNDGLGCPYAGQGSLDLVHFPSAHASKCDKGYETANGCLAHGMKRYFGAVLAEPQGVRIKDNSTGTWGFGRSPLTSVSLVAESIYDEVLPEIYTDSAMPVNCKLAAGRDESDFYDGLGIVGEGPLVFGTGHTIDGQLHHGSPGPLGLRAVSGGDPAGSTDYFALGQSGDQTSGDWRKVRSGGSTYKENYAAGTAFLELRRADAKGLQLSRLSEHQMQAVVQAGLSGWVWTSPGTRVWGPPLTNPVWIAVNMILRARGIRLGANATPAQLDHAETLFDVPAAIAAAAVCNQPVTKLVGTSSETQFQFRGTLQEEKPLRDWVQEVLMNALGYYTFAFGKLKIGIRSNSSTVEAFTDGNILFGSLQLAPLKPSFNHLTANFADEEYEFVTNSVMVYDIDHAGLIGGAAGPLFLKSTLNLAGTSSKSQAARIVAARMREELGGITPEEWKKAREIGFRTTVLALNTEPGMVCSMNHPDMPGGWGEFRVNSWRLNRDYSIDIQGRTSTDSMYDLVAGPKPADVAASPVPVEFSASPGRPVWHPNAEVPDAYDPLYGPDDRTFGLRQEYSTLADGSGQAAIVVSGEMPVTDFVPGIPPPVIRGSAALASGGALRGGRGVFFAVCARTADNRFSPPSNIVGVFTPHGSDLCSIALGAIEWPAGEWAGYAVFGAEQASAMCAQVEASGPLPSSITCAEALKRSTWTMPNRQFDRVRVKAKTLHHAGVIGTPVTEVRQDTLVCAGLAGLADNWSDRVVSVISDAADGSAKIWNFRVDAYDQETGTFHLWSDPVFAEVEPADVLIVRAQATAAGSDWVEDSGWSSGVYPSGMTPGEEAGRMVRVIAGAGRGQVRRIVANTATRLTVDQGWDIVPDATSRFVIEAASWEYSADGASIRNAKAGVPCEVRLIGDNMRNRTLLVCAIGVDRQGGESPEDYFSPFREIWIYGRPPGVRLLAGDYTVERGDRTILADASAGEITITLLPAAEMQGLPLTIIRTNNTGGAVTVAPAPDDSINGSASFVLTAKDEALNVTAT